MLHQMYLFIYYQTPDNNRIRVTLEIQKDFKTEDTLLKELYFDEKEAEKFVTLFNIYLKKLNIVLQTDDEEESRKEGDNNEEVDADNAIDNDIEKDKEYVNNVINKNNNEIK